MKTTTIALAGLVLVLGGCRGDRTDKPPRQFLPDMDDQPRWHAQGQSDFFDDGRTMRPRVPGTVAFGRDDVLPQGDTSETEWGSAIVQTRTDLLREDDAYYRGVDAEGRYLRTMPMDVTTELIERGQERFNIYCATCHGYTGDGLGTVGTRWSYPLPTWHDAKYYRGGEKGDDGYLWWTALNGVYDDTGAQKMPGYKHALSERDAWAVVTYIRALQRTQNATLDDASDAGRQQLSTTRRGRPRAGAGEGDASNDTTGGAQ